ncbi:mfsB [Symbiodinium natans]|uniref:MfsB protein n=1 Tax=Symbiodinium natans TaxID=878477 RepID=A0A812IL49_9DINO|nr:mfsB [Symbiodinium natans]
MAGRLTRKAMAVLCCISLIDCINFTMLNPYVDELVAHVLDKPPGDPGISIYVSILVGSYALCEVLFSPMWGLLADKFGRRPVLLTGLAGSAVSSVLLGLADSYPTALGARLLDGFFCGNECVANTYLGELVDSDNEAQAFGTLGAVFSFGLFLGPMLGGGLAHPAGWEPQLFADTFFERHPFLLANLLFAVLVTAVFALGLVALPETRRNGQDANLLQDTEGGGARRLGHLLPQGRKLRQLLIASSLLSGYVAARLNSFILVSSLPRTLHGLAISSHQLACIQACAAVMLALNQVTCYTCLVNRAGNHASYALGLLWTIVVTLPMPLYYMAEQHQSTFWRLLPITLWQATSQLGFGIAFPICTVLVNKECSAHNRAVVNGWCGSLNALARGLGPEAAGALVHVGCALETWDHRLGRYLGFYVNLIPASVSAVLVLRQRTGTSASECPWQRRSAAAEAEGEACELGGR